MTRHGGHDRRPAAETSQEVSSRDQCSDRDPNVPIVLPSSAGRPIKRSFSIGGHRTSISIEAPFWDALLAVATERRTSVAGLVTAIDQARGGAGLSSAIRVFVLEHYRNNGSTAGQGRRTT